MGDIADYQTDYYYDEEDDYYRQLHTYSDLELIDLCTHMIYEDKSYQKTKYTVLVKGIIEWYNHNSPISKLSDKQRKVLVMNIVNDEYSNYDHYDWDMPNGD